MMVCERTQQNKTVVCYGCLASGTTSIILIFIMNSLHSLIFISLLISFVSNGCCLECYVCVNQDNNHEKCLNTIKTCEQGEEMCMTEVRWGTMPYWQQGGDKQYYVSKSCATKQICENTRARNMKYCTYIWYEDWRCSHCCQGDRCNYYVILGASTTQVSFLVLGASLVTTLLWQRLFNG